MTDRGVLRKRFLGASRRDQEARRNLAVARRNLDATLVCGEAVQRDPASLTDAELGEAVALYHAAKLRNSGLYDGIMVEYDRRLAAAAAEREAQRRERTAARVAPSATPAALCSRCEKRPRHFDDLCKRCANEAGARPRGKV